MRPTLKSKMFILAAAFLLFSPSARGDVLDPLAFQSLGTLDGSGKEINTDTATLTTVDASGNTQTFQGVTTPQGVVVFDFDSVNLTGGDFSAHGTPAFAILSRSDLTLNNTSIEANGFNVPGPGGYGPGTGPGAGGSVGFTPNRSTFASGGGGGFGAPGLAGISNDPNTNPGYGGPANGDLLVKLEGGSGGGEGFAGLQPHSGGPGGGAVELGAVGTLSLLGNSAIHVEGGLLDVYGGGGAGGGILLHGQTLDLVNGALDAASISTGGGGRVVLYSQSLNVGPNFQIYAGNLREVAVPEPASILLLALGLPVFLRSLRCR